MNCTITALGTGSAISPEFDNSNFLFTFEENGRTKRYLLDCGITFPKIWKRHFDTCYLDGILITHTHGDHVGGLDEVVASWKKLADYPIKLYLPRDVFDWLWDWKLRGGLKPSKDDPYHFFDPTFDAFPPEFGDAHWIRNIHVSPDFPVYGVSFRIGDKVIWISGDSSFMPEKFETSFWKARHGVEMPDTILHEVSFDDDSNKSHSYYDRLKVLPADWRERIMLYHYTARDREIEQDGFRRYVKPFGELREKYFLAL